MDPPEEEAEDVDTMAGMEEAPNWLEEGGGEGVDGMIIINQQEVLILLLPF
jgi:hypothetical protein